MDDVLLNPDVTAREWLRELLLFANVGQCEYEMGNLPHIFCWPGSDWLRQLTMAIEKNSAHAKSMNCNKYSKEVLDTGYIINRHNKLRLIQTTNEVSNNINANYVFSLHSMFNCNHSQVVHMLHVIIIVS